MLESKKHIILAVAILGIFAVGIIFMNVSGNQPGEGQQDPSPTGPEQGSVVTPPREVLSVGGRVTSVTSSAGAFEILQSQENKAFRVTLGEETTFIKLVFPFDLNNPPSDATFTPERQSATLADMEVGDSVFIRSAHPIREGEDIVNPVEVQILP